MKQMIKVLVLGVGGNVSQGILKALRRSQMEIEVIGACVGADSLGLYMCDRAYISPYAKADDFLPWLIALCNRENVDIVLSGVEEVIMAVAAQESRFRRETSAKFIFSSKKCLEIGQDKYLTCQWLAENGCCFPRFCLPEDSDAAAAMTKACGYPLIAKPRRGKGSNGIRLIYKEDELQAIKGKDYVLQEYVGTEDEEYTAGCYCDKKGELRGIIVMRRILKDGGTVWAEVVQDRDVLQECVKICNAFCPRGPLNIQLRRAVDGRVVCFELNVRFSGTTPIRDAFGFRDVIAMIREYVLDESIGDCFHIAEGEVYRHIEELYLPAGTTRSMMETGVFERGR